MSGAGNYSSSLIPEGMIWSYSKLTTFEHCPLAFRLQYIDKLPQTNNAYAEYGTLCHSLLERWADGTLAAFELGSQYEQEFDQGVVHAFPPFPKGLGAKYYNAGKHYFDHFNGFGVDVIILSSEERFTTTVGGYPFVGIADLLLQDKASGDIILMDHKSKSLSAMKKGLRAQLRQLYLYASFVKKKLGIYPAKLVLNLFREQEFLEERFDPAAFDAAIEWATGTVADILTEEAWQPCKLDYFCRFICSVAYHCPVYLEQEGG